MNLFIFAIALASAVGYTRGADSLLGSETLTFESERKLFSENGQYRLDLQSDGNLVVYNVPTGHHVWNTQTDGSGANEAWMRPEGELWLMKGGEMKWRSFTQSPGAYLKLENDGNLVIYRRKPEMPIWSAFTGLIQWKAN
jgi:hypothetical protein